MTHKSILSRISENLLHYIFFYRMHYCMDKLYEKATSFTGQKHLSQLCQAIDSLDSQLNHYQNFIVSRQINHSWTKYCKYYKQWSLISKTMVLIEANEIEMAQQFINAAVDDEQAFPSFVARTFKHIIDWRCYIKINFQTNSQDSYFEKHEENNNFLINEIRKTSFAPQIKTALISFLFFEQAYMAFYWHAPSYCDICLDRLHKLPDGSFINKNSLCHKFNFMEKLYGTEFLQMAINMVPPKYYPTRELAEMDKNQPEF